MSRRRQAVLGVTLVVLDFDGTLVEADADEFAGEMASGISDLLGRDIGGEWRRWAALVDADPDRHGWRCRGEVTASARGDPYLRASCIARALCDALGEPADLWDRERGVEAVFRSCYARCRGVARPEARAVLRALLGAGLAVWVVTNSPAEAVKHELGGLGEAALEGIGICGNARKLLYDPSPRDGRYDALFPVRVPGVDGRAVVVKRGHYYDALVRCWQAAGCGPAEMLVCGDSFELDLALPLALGAQLHLLRQAHTSAETAAWLERQPRGGVSSDLWALLERLALPSPPH